MLRGCCFCLQMTTVYILYAKICPFISYLHRLNPQIFTVNIIRMEWKEFNAFTKYRVSVPRPQTAGRIRRCS